MNNRQEQIEQAKRLIATGISKDLVEILQQKFPELKESEDERIRKWILDGLDFYADAIDAPEDHKKAITYLVKKNNVIGGLSWKKYDENFDDDSGIPALLKYEALIRRNGKYSLGFSIISGDEYILLKDIEAAIKQQPAEWSEEDENKIERLAFLVSVAEEKEMISPSESVDLRNFIKSIRPQPKQEWSEEDERNLYNIIEAIKYVFDVSEDTKGSRLINWLKFLCQQRHWRPSEEQMRAVFDASERNDKLGSVLRNLYNDLRKLL